MCLRRATSGCENDEHYVVYDVSTTFRSKISAQLRIENTNCCISCMQLDTGCAMSLAAISLMKEVCPGVKIDPTHVILSTYSGEILCVCEDISVTYNAYANAETYLCAVD